MGGRQEDAVSLSFRNVSLLGFSPLLAQRGTATPRSFQKPSTHNSSPQHCEGGHREEVEEEEERHKLIRKQSQKWEVFPSPRLQHDFQNGQVGLEAAVL